MNIFKLDNLLKQISPISEILIQHSMPFPCIKWILPANQKKDGED